MSHDIEMRSSWRKARKIHMRLLYPFMLALPATSACGMGAILLMLAIVDVFIDGCTSLIFLVVFVGLPIWLFASLLIFPIFLYSLAIPFRVRSLRYDDAYLYVRKCSEIHGLLWTDVSNCIQEDPLLGKEPLWENIMPSDFSIVFQSGEKIRIPSCVVVTGPLQAMFESAEKKAEELRKGG